MNLNSKTNVVIFTFVHENNFTQLLGVRGPKSIHKEEYNIVWEIRKNIIIIKVNYILVNLILLVCKIG